MLEEIIGDFPLGSNNNKLLAKFCSGKLRMMDTIRLIWLFLVIARTSIGIPVYET